jgi:cation:H+ antiporter
VLAGLGLLILGGEALVRGSATLASKVGISPLVIGLVVVSAATSAPELAVSIGAVFNGEPDLAVGNVIGSNIANILLILGVAALALLPIAFTGFVIARWEGAVFLSLYVAYTVYLVLDSTGHDAAVGFNGAMLSFVLPLLAASLLAFTSFEIGVLKERKSRRVSPNEA